MRIVPKRRLRLRVWADPCRPPCLAEIRLQPDETGWTARLVLSDAGGGQPVLLGRRFRASRPELAAGKMLCWVRGYFGRCEPLSDLRAGGSEGGAVTVAALP